MICGCLQGDVPRLWCHLCEGGAPEKVYITKPRLGSPGRRLGSGRGRLPGGRAGPKFPGSLLRRMWRNTEAWGHVLWRLCEKGDSPVCTRQTGRVGRGAGGGVLLTGRCWCSFVIITAGWKQLFWNFEFNRAPLWYSLQVYSGYRFLLAASDRKIPVAILNIGPTRADHLAELKVRGRCGEVLTVIQPHWPSWTSCLNVLYSGCKTTNYLI